MSETSKSILELPTKTFLAGSDKILVIANAASSNGGNVATITVTNFFGNSSSFTVGQSNPANSTSWSGPSGTIFFSDTFGYVAIANNTLRRFAIASF